MAYVSNAMYRAAHGDEGQGRSADATVVEAAYQTLVHYFATQASVLDAFHVDALALIPTGRSVLAAGERDRPDLREGDGFGKVPGYDDGNAATAEQAGWRR